MHSRILSLHDIWRKCKPNITLWNEKNDLICARDLSLNLSVRFAKFCLFKSDYAYKSSSSTLTDDHQSHPRINIKLIDWPTIWLTDWRFDNRSYFRFQFQFVLCSVSVSVFILFFSYISLWFNFGWLKDYYYIAGARGS